MHTHTAHYQGEMAVRMALGDDVTARLLGHAALHVHGSRGGVRGRVARPGAAGGPRRVRARRGSGDDRQGLRAEAQGHVTIVVDRGDRVLLGVAIGGPGATEAIHEAVLAIKTRMPIAVLADTIHAFPTTARVMGGLFVEAARELGLQ